LGGRSGYDAILAVWGSRAPRFEHLFPQGGRDLRFVTVAPDVRGADQGEYAAEVTVPGGLLNEGMYWISLALTSFPKGSHLVHFYEQKALTVNVRDPRDSSTLRYGFAGEFPGAVRPNLNWTIRRV
jgi:hypothetical protein